MTQAQIDEVAARRAAGESYAQIAAAFRAKGIDKSEEALRGYLRRRARAPKPASPTLRQIAQAAVAPPQRSLPQRGRPLKGRPMEERAAAADYSRVLVISDMHMPFQHVDTVPFLTAIKEKYEPTHVVCIGDEIDQHNLSFHDTDPDLPGPADELRQAIEELRPLYRLFPRVDVLDSNHGSLLYRKGKHHGIPRKYLREYGDVLEAPAGWQWHMDLLIRLPTGQDVYFHHGIQQDVMKVVAARGLCVVQGHYHTKFGIGYLGTPRDLLWGMNVGCSIDKNALAFAYDRNNLGRPLIGHGIILSGQPRLLPMILETGGRWNGICP
jgi:hypothetical protein